MAGGANRGGAPIKEFLWERTEVPIRTEAVADAVHRADDIAHAPLEARVVS